MNEKFLTGEEINIILALINSAQIRVADIPTVNVIIQKLLMLKEIAPINLEGEETH